MSRPPRDEEFSLGVSARLRELFGSTPLHKIADQLDGIVSKNALWDYANTISLPRPEVLAKIAEKFDVSVDWLLTGQESLFARNKDEEELLDTYRRAESMGVAEEAKRYMSFLVGEQFKVAPTVDAVLDKLSVTLGLDTLGKRLRHLRESELRMSVEAMAKELGINKKELMDYEADKARPSAQVLTALWSHHKDQFNLDWLLTGKSGK